jgi:hypothetical protein
MMHGFVKFLEEIREKLRELRMLYLSSLGSLVRKEEPLEDEREAIESSDELVGEDEIFRILG